MITRGPNAPCRMCGGTDFYPAGGCKPCTKDRVRIQRGTGNHDRNRSKIAALQNRHHAQKAKGFDVAGSEKRLGRNAGHNKPKMPQMAREQETLTEYTDGGSISKPRGEQRLGIPDPFTGGAFADTARAMARARNSNGSGRDPVVSLKLL